MDEAIREAIAEDRDFVFTESALAACARFSYSVRRLFKVMLGPVETKLVDFLDRVSDAIK